MEHIRWKSLVVIKDILQFSGERLWASLVHDAIKRSRGQVLVYLFTSCKKTLIKRYPFMLQCTLLEEIDLFDSIFDKISNLLKNTEGTTVFLDSIDIIYLDNSFNQAIILLRKISQYATVIVRVHDECISAQNWEKLSSVSHITYSLDLKDMNIPLCTTVSYKTNGKKTVKVETIHIDDSFHLFFIPYKAQDSNASAENNNNSTMPESSFDIGLHLKKSELEAKKHVSLPYEAAQKEEELIKLHGRENQKIRAGGRIIYTPDEADDFDESDPDDDLEI
ncbi:Protein phosphatase 1 regulatory subunit [Dirofilaria immitis]